MGGRLCKKRNWDDDDDDDFDGTGNYKLDDDDDMDPALIKNSQLPRVFADCDTDGSGQIEYPEFLAGFGLDNVSRMPP